VSLSRKTTTMKGRKKVFPPNTMTPFSDTLHSVLLEVSSVRTSFVMHWLSVHKQQDRSSKGQGILKRMTTSLSLSLVVKTVFILAFLDFDIECLPLLHCRLYSWERNVWVCNKGQLGLSSLPFFGHLWREPQSQSLQQEFLLFLNKAVWHE
jgi:hypothetical protein